MVRNYRLFESWLQWCIVTSLSWSVGIIFAEGIFQLVGIDLTYKARLIGISLIAGALVGIAQRHVLQPPVKTFPGWVAASTVGALFGMIASAGVLSLNRSGWSWILAGAIGGFITGAAQALTLHNQRGLRAGWTQGSTVSWTAAFLIGFRLLQNPTPEFTPPIDLALLLTALAGWVVISLLAVITLLAISPTNLSREDRVRLFDLP